MISYWNTNNKYYCPVCNGKLVYMAFLNQRYWTCNGPRKWDYSIYFLKNGNIDYEVILLNSVIIYRSKNETVFKISNNEFKFDKCFDFDEIKKILMLL